MDRATLGRTALFTAAAAGPAMLIVLVLRIANLLGQTEAVVDLIVLLVIGLASILVARLLMRT